MSIKEMVLSMLLQSDAPLSGEWLARKLKVSRNAIWKAVASLREEGYTITAATNRGYTLVRDSEILSAATLRQALHTQVFGRSLCFLKETESTNNVLKAMAAEGAPHGLLCVADTQTGGKGRFGRRFFSPEGMGAYFSLLVRPKLTAEKAVLLTSLAAVATARAIEALTPVRVQIKWVNDLYIDGRKVCGILTEAGMDFESRQLDYAVVGIGVNVNPCEFPPELKDIATSVGNVAGKSFSRAQLIAGVCEQFEALYVQMESGEFMEEYRGRSCVIGSEITVLRGDERFDAVALDIDAEGNLLVRKKEDGTQLKLYSGEISIKMPRREEE